MKERTHLRLTCYLHLSLRSDKDAMAMKHSLSRDNNGYNASIREPGVQLLLAYAC